MWDAKSLVFDIMDLVVECIDYMLQYTNRKANSLAHCLAKYDGDGFGICMGWFFAFHLCVNPFDCVLLMEIMKFSF